MHRQTVDIIGVPMDYGGNRRGVDMGPSTIRYTGLKDAIIKTGLDYHDCGNIDVPIRDDEHESDFITYIKKVNDDVYKMVSISHKRNNFPLVLGGDHSISIGSVIASLDYHKKIGVIWIDAHADFNKFETSPSGNMHGMPLCTVVGKNQALDITCRQNNHYVNEKNVVIIGARDLDIGEVELLRQSNVTVFSMQYIDKHGMYHTVKKAIEIASYNTSGIHVSFDIDSVCPEQAPGVGTPVDGGLTFREIHLAMELLYESEKMVCLDVVELNPITDICNRTGELAVSLIQSSLGKNII